MSTKSSYILIQNTFAPINFRNRQLFTDIYSMLTHNNLQMNRFYFNNKSIFSLKSNTFGEQIGLSANRM